MSQIKTLKDNDGDYLTFWQLGLLTNPVGIPDVLWQNRRRMMNWGFSGLIPSFVSSMQSRIWMPCIQSGRAVGCFASGSGLPLLSCNTAAVLLFHCVENTLHCSALHCKRTLTIYTYARHVKCIEQMKNLCLRSTITGNIQSECNKTLIPVILPIFLL